MIPRHFDESERFDECIPFEYGDPFTVMGYGTHLMHMNAKEKMDLGWLEEDEIARYHNNVFRIFTTLLPLASQETGLKVIVFERSRFEDYIIEYRKPIGYDKAIKNNDPQKQNYGFQVRLATKYDEVALIHKKLHRKESTEINNNHPRKFLRASFGKKDTFIDKIDTLKIFTNKIYKNSIELELDTVF